MREIFFRGKRFDNGQWVYGYVALYTDMQGNHKCRILTDGDMFYAVDPATVGQYTGAIDKNGNKIFEGDILYPISKRPYLVFWDEGNVKFALKNSRDFCIDFYQDIADEYIVIGNMYDNPILLKSGLLGKSKE